MFREVTDRIRDAEVDVVLNLTAGMGGDMVFWRCREPFAAHCGHGYGGASERVAHIAQCRPEICTLDCGTMNFAEADYVMINTPGTLTAMGRMMTELALSLRLKLLILGICGMPSNWWLMACLGPMLWCSCVWACLGGAPDDLNTLMAMVNNVPDGWTFSAFGLGRHQMPLVAASVLAGGNVRVGLEDNLMLDRGVLRKTISW